MLNLTFLARSFLVEHQSLIPVCRTTPVLGVNNQLRDFPLSRDERKTSELRIKISGLIAKLFLLLVVDVAMAVTPRIRSRDVSYLPLGP